MLAIIDESLALDGRALKFGPDTPLLGEVAELDSMAVVDLIGLLEERFGIAFEDDEISGATFETVGTLVRAVSGKLAESY